MKTLTRPPGAKTCDGCGHKLARWTFFEKLSLCGLCVVRFVEAAKREVRL